MKTGLTRKQKVTEFYFNEHDDLAEIYTHNTDLKKHLLRMSLFYFFALESDPTLARFQSHLNALINSIMKSK